MAYLGGASNNTAVASFAGIGGGPPKSAQPTKPKLPPMPPLQTQPVKTAAPPPLAPPPTLTNTVAPNPDLTKAMDAMNIRVQQLQANEGKADPNLTKQVDRLDDRMSSDTRQRQADFAAQDIKARARASQGALKEAMARRGMMGSGVESGEAAKIDAQAQRDMARSSAGIAMDDEKRLDALTLGGQQIMSAPSQLALQQTAQTNSVLPLQLQAALAPTQSAQAQQGLNLQQYQTQAQLAQNAQQMAQNQADRERQAQLQYLSMAY
jgi:hypothetical protein